MRKVKVSAVQMKCTTDVWENIANAEKFVRQAKEDGANIVLLPELFERQYFCQERRYDYYNFAKPTLENDAVKHFAKLAKELGLDAIHDTVHEMARDEARHGKAFQGLLNRYFK